MRSKIFNLKLNSDLRFEVLSNFISPIEFAKMSTEEMASKEIKNERQSISQNSVRESMLPFVEGKKCHNYCCEFGFYIPNNFEFEEKGRRRSRDKTTPAYQCQDCGDGHRCNIGSICIDHLIL